MILLGYHHDLNPKNVKHLIVQFISILNNFLYILKPKAHQKYFNRRSRTRRKL